MRVIRTELPDVLLIEPVVHGDARGFFLETYHHRRYVEAGIPAVFVQDNHSRSARGTLRGLHAQLARPQGKLVRVLAGAIFDVAADVRRGSPTFGRWVGATLDAASARQIWVPPGFVHGFCVLSDGAEVEYKVTDYYDPGDELAVAWDDPDLAIAWPLGAPTLSERDRRAPRLRDVMDRLPTWQDPHAL